MIVLSRKIKLYIVDIEEKTVSRLEELLYGNPQLGIKLIGHSHNYTSCVNDLSRAKEADVYLISAFLPDQMGIYLIEKIKKVNPEGKVIIMLSSSTQNQAEIAREKGADEIILKPFKAKQLIDTIYQLAVTEEEEEEEFTNDNFEPSTSSYDEPVSFESVTPAPPVENSRVIENPAFSSFVDEEYGDFLDSDGNSSNYHLQERNQKRFEISQSAPEIEEEKEEEKIVPPPTNKPINNMYQDGAKRAIFDIYAENPIGNKIYQDPDELDGNKPNQLVVTSSVTSAGKTTLLVNAAIAIHKYSEYKPKICIVDFNLAFPSVLYKFHQDELVMPSRNLFDIVEDKELLDEELIKQALATHEPTGIKILETPADAIRDISSIDRNVIIPLFEKLRAMFDLVLVDTSTNVRADASSYPLTISDKNLIVMEPDLSSLLHTRKFITMLKTVENALGGDKFTNRNIYILNKDNPKTGIHVDTAKRTIHNNPIRLTIPEDVNITHLSNNGQFVIHSSLGIAREIKELARIIYPLEKDLYLGKSPATKNDKKKKWEVGS